MKHELKYLVLLSMITFLSSMVMSSPDCGNINYQGEGTASSPFLIEDIDELQCIEKNPKGEYEIVEDIDASETSEWSGGFEPISQFNGSVLGRNNSINNFELNAERDSYAGIFEIIGSEASVNNFSIYNFTLENGNWYVGSLAGQNNGNISKISSEGSIEGEGAVGGLVGRNKGSINEGQSEVEVEGYHYVGGLVGENLGLVKYSYSEGSVKIFDDGGGFIGMNEGTVKSSYSVSKVNSNNWTYSGNFIGLNTDGDIKASYWLKNKNPESYWYKEPVANYDYLNGSALDIDLMKGDACGMRRFNFSSAWDTVENSTPKLQTNQSFENETRNCSKYIKEVKENKNVKEGSKLLENVENSDRIIQGFIVFLLVLGIYKIYN